MVEDVFFKIYSLRLHLKHDNWDHTGVHDIHQYLKATNEKTTSPEKKLNWVLNVFNVDDEKKIINIDEMGDIIISLFNISSIQYDENKLLSHLEEMFNNVERLNNPDMKPSVLISNAVTSYFISILVTSGNLFNRMLSVPQITADDITVLAKKTKLSKKEVISQHKYFTAMNPTGKIGKKEFLQRFKEKSLNPAMEADAMFRVLDNNFSGEIGFCKFLLAEYSGLMESDGEKLIWIFNVCDSKGEEVIEGQEVDAVVTALFSLVGIRLENSILEARAEELVEAVTDDYMKQLQKKEFVNYAMECDFVVDIINDDVVNGLSQL